MPEPPSLPSLASAVGLPLQSVGPSLGEAAPWVHRALAGEGDGSGKRLSLGRGMAVFQGRATIAVAHVSCHVDSDGGEAGV